MHVKANNFSVRNRSYNPLILRKVKVVTMRAEREIPSTIMDIHG